jgi:hypothetical protein
MLRALVILAFLLGACLYGADVGIGTSRAEILEQFGKPTSIARRGDHEIFLYPKGARIEFVEGKVVDVKGTLPNPLPAGTAAAAPAVTKETSPTPEAAPRATPAAPSPAARTPAAPAKTTAAKEDSDDYSPAAAANELAKHVEKMDTPWGVAPEKEIAHSPLDSVPSFLAGLLMRFGFTVLALKLAFKFWEMDAFWRGIFAIAGVDLALHATFELLGPATSGFTTMAGVENGIPGLVLIYTINRFCFNKRLQNAVLTAAAVKLVVTLCYIFAGVAALNALFG